MIFCNLIQTDFQLKLIVLYIFIEYNSLLKNTSIIGIKYLVRFVSQTRILTLLTLINRLKWYFINILFQKYVYIKIMEEIFNQWKSVIMFFYKNDCFAMLKIKSDAIQLKKDIIKMFNTWNVEMQLTWMYNHNQKINA